MARNALQARQPDASPLVTPFLGLAAITICRCPGIAQVTGFLCLGVGFDLEQPRTLVVAVEAGSLTCKNGVLVPREMQVARAKTLLEA